MVVFWTEGDLPNVSNVAVELHKALKKEKIVPSVSKQKFLKIAIYFWRF